MSHDTDKLIRQLSLVAFLMAELRPLTARDIKGNVEGYQEMSDEAFARRFYSDRAELVSLGVPLDSHRDEHTGEELYTLRSERYFLPPLELDDDELLLVSRPQGNRKLFLSALARKTTLALERVGFEAPKVVASIEPTGAGSGERIVVDVVPDDRCGEDLQARQVPPLEPGHLHQPADPRERGRRRAGRRGARRRSLHPRR